MKPTKWVLALMGLTVLTFAKTFGAEYLQWDDDVFIVRNPFLTQAFWPTMVAFFSGPFHGDYVPLVLANFWVEIQLFGLSSSAQHTSNLLFHLANIWLLFLCLNFILKDWKTIIFLLLIFAIHPLQVENVMWVAERKTLLATFIMLLAFYCYLRGEKFQSRALKIAYVILFGVSLFAKTAYVLLPVLCVLLARNLFKNKTREVFVWQILAMSMGGLVVLFRLYAYHNVVSLSEATFNQERLLRWPLLALNAFGFYWRMIFFPTAQSILYSMFSWNPLTVTHISVALAGVIGYFSSFRKQANPQWAFFGLWFFLFLLPVLQLIPMVTYVNDRFMYLPIVGFAGLVAAAMKLSQWETRKFGVLMILLAVAMSWGSYKRSEVWVSNLELWRDTVKKVPQSPIAHNNLALELQTRGDIQGAIMEFQRTVEVGRGTGIDGYALNNLGNIFSVPSPLRDLGAAEKYFRDSIGVAQRVAETFEPTFNLAVLLGAQQGRGIEAAELFRGLIQKIEASGDLKYEPIKESAQRNLLILTR